MCARSAVKVLKSRAAAAQLHSSAAMTVGNVTRAYADSSAAMTVGNVTRAYAAEGQGPEGNSDEKDEDNC